MLNLSRQEDCEKLTDEQLTELTKALVPLITTVRKKLENARERFNEDKSFLESLLANFALANKIITDRANASLELPNPFQTTEGELKS